MSFATEIVKPDTERFILISLKPRKYLGVGTFVSGSTYTFTFPFSSYGVVTINGVAVSSGNLSLSNGVLSVTSATNLASASNYVIAEIPIYLTGTKARDSYGNAAGIPEAIWDPFIKAYPSWAQSIKNLGDTVFSIDGTSLEVISDGRWVQELLGNDYSWSRADVDAWVCVNDIDTSKKIFTGEVISLNISSNSVSINIADIFNKLTKKSEFGTSSQAYFSSVPPEYIGKPIPLVIGTTSPSIIAPGYRISEAYGTPASTLFYHQTIGLPCVPTSGNLDTSTSVDFLVGRIVGTTLKKLNFGTISYAYEHYMVKTVYSDTSSMDVGVRLLYLACSDVSSLRIGDYVPGQGNICALENFNHAALNYNVAIVKTDYFFDGATIYTSGTIAVPSISNNVYPSMSVWLDGTDPATYEVSNVTLGLVPLWAIATYSGRYVPFTVSYSSSYDPDIGMDVTHVYATITSGNISDSSKPVLPGKQKFMCRFSPDEPLTHAEALEITCRRAGLDINAASFAQADSDLNSDVVMTIPAFGKSEWPTLLEVAQSIIKSTFGVLSFNEDREVEYLILKDPDSLTSIGDRDNSNVLAASFSTSVEYQDAVYQIYFENDEYKDQESLVSNGPFSLEISSLARYLHKTDKTLIFKHVLENIYGIKDKIFQYLSSPTVQYTFDTASHDLNSNIGNVVSIDNQSVASNSEQINAMIVGIKSTANKTTITTNELRGVT